MLNPAASKTLGFALALSILAGCGGDGADAPPPTSDPATQPATPAPTGDPAPAAGGDLVAEGRQVYSGAGICFTCHGQEGVGTPLGPALNDGEWLWIEDPSGDLHTQLADIIRTGVASPAEYPAPMPPMGGASLNDDQLEAVTAYVVSLNQ